MSSFDTGGKDRSQMLFAVAVDEGAARMLAGYIPNIPGYRFAGSFGDYITVEKRPHFPPAMKAAAACIALIDFERDPELAIETAQRLRQIFAHRIHMVAVGSNLDASLLLRAMREGCVECLSKPLVPAELEASLRRMREQLQHGMQPKNSTGRVLAFFGAKGGVGTTTLAVHLAAHLVMQHHRKTLIIDHKHQLGHVALYLGLKDTQYHFNELLQNGKRLDAELLRGFVVRHRSGLDVLASPNIANESQGKNQDELDGVMDFLRREYDYILIDSSVSYQEAKLSIIEQSDDVYLISTPDVASLRDLVRLVEHISLNPSATGKLRVVMNRSTSNESISAQQIHEVVRTPVTHTVPNNYLELLRSINQGEPIAPGGKTSFDMALTSWAEEIVGGKEEDRAPAAMKLRMPFWKQLRRAG